LSLRFVGLSLEARGGCAQGELIALGAEAADDAYRDVREIGTGSERLAGMDV